MDRGLFLAASAASNLMERQAVVAQNLANVSTVGFKRVFDRLASAPVGGMPASLPGARAYAVELTPGVDVRPGPLTTTNNPLDVALVADMYLAASPSAGEEAFTRRGTLAMDDQGVLRLPSGQAAVGQDGGPIAIPAGFVPSIASDGTVWAQDPANAANRQELGRLRVVKGSDVSLRADGLYSLGSAEAPADGAKVLVSGAVEQSNVSAADSLAAIIETSRLYELNTKLIASFSSLDEKGSELLSNWQ